jgi:hypothetical protein
LTVIFAQRENARREDGPVSSRGGGSSEVRYGGTARGMGAARSADLVAAPRPEGFRPVTARQAARPGVGEMLATPPGSFSLTS